MKVNIIPSALVLVISGGSFQTWRFGEALVLDASGSYDVDTGARTALKFVWSCEAFVLNNPVTEQNSSLCPDYMIRACASEDTSVLTFNNTFAAVIGDIIGTTMKIQATISDTGYNRSISEEIFITLTEALAPKITLLFAPTKINTNRQIQIKTSVEVFQPASVVWSLDDPSVDLAAMSLVPSLSSSYLQPGTYLSSLVIKGQTLTEGLVYGFTLTIPGQATSLTVTIVTPRPPTPGTFTISPDYGREMHDAFLLVTSKWSDIELPLSYEFGFFSSKEEVMLPLQGKSESSQVTDALLPGGLLFMNYSVICVVNTYNSLNVKAALSRSVAVYPTHSFAEEFERTIEDQLAKVALNQDFDRIKAVVSTGIAILNRANCSLAPTDCLRRGRKECHFTPHTCGPCLDGYIGENAGDSNIACDSNVESAIVNSSCTDSSQCQALQSCFEGDCLYRNKSCPLQSIVSRGYCQFEHITSGRVVAQCPRNDFSCRVRVVCDDGYYGISCSETLSSLKSKQNTRFQLIFSMNYTAQYEDFSGESLMARAAMVYDLGRTPSELIETSCALLQLEINSIFSGTERAEIDDLAIVQLLTVLDNCADLYVNVIEEHRITLIQKSRKMQFSIQEVFVLARYNRELRGKYMQLASESMFSGQNEKEFASSSHSRSVVSKTELGVAIGQMLPQTQQEKLLRRPKSAVYFDGVDTAESPVVSGRSRAILFEENNAILDANSTLYTSNPISVQYTLSSSNNVSLTDVLSPNMIVVIQNTFSQNYITNSSNVVAPAIHTTKCAPQNASVIVNYTCPGGEAVAHKCSGRYEIIRSVCRPLRSRPACSILVDKQGASSCHVMSFSDSNVTCNCTISLGFPTPISQTQSTSMEASGYMEMVAMAEYTFEGFLETFRELDEVTFADVESGLIVICMFATLWICGALGTMEIGRGHYFTSTVYPLQPTSNLSDGTTHATRKRTAQARADSNPESDRIAKKIYVLR